MKLDDLKHVFKSSAIGPVDTRGYIVSLLNKFEVALTWDSRTLLIPSLLPCEEDLQLPSTNPVRVKVLCRKYYCMIFGLVDMCKYFVKALKISFLFSANHHHMFMYVVCNLLDFPFGS